jgi:hypothetical protein
MFGRVRDICDQPVIRAVRNDFGACLFIPLGQVFTKMKESSGRI